MPQISLKRGSKKRNLKNKFYKKTTSQSGWFLYFNFEMKKYLLKYSLLFAFSLISKPALAVPVGGTIEKEYVFIFGVIAFYIAYLWFWISAAITFGKSKSNRISLYLSSIIVSFFCLGNLPYQMENYRDGDEGEDGFFINIGILLSVLVVNIFAAIKFKKEHAKKNS